MRQIRYIHERPEWPALRWDDAALLLRLVSVRHKQGRLLGRMSGLGLAFRTQANVAILTSDVVKSSAIEGEMLSPDEVRSSIALKLGLDNAGLPPPGRHVEGIVELMLDATQGYEEPLSETRLFRWHDLLFPEGRSNLTRITTGAWRGGTMHVISGPIGRERVHFQAPPPHACRKRWPGSSDGSTAGRCREMGHSSRSIPCSEHRSRTSGS